jgi:predicted metal-dependent hydrolase
MKKNSIAELCIKQKARQERAYLNNYLAKVIKIPNDSVYTKNVKRRIG